MKRKSNPSRRTVLGAGWSALALYGWTPLCGAQTDPAPARGMPLRSLPNPVITMDEKVAEANHIFIGFGKGIHYVNCKGAQVATIDEACGDKPYDRDAIVEIEVIRELYLSFPKRMAIAVTGVNGALIPFGSQPPGHDAAVRQYMSGPRLYFGRAQTNQIWADAPDGARKVVGSITLHQFHESYAINGPKENPLPLSYLQEAVAAIARRVEREKKTSDSKPALGNSPK